MKSLRHAVTLLVPALFAFGAALALVVFAVARRVVTPMRRATDTEILAVDTTKLPAKLDGYTVKITVG